MAALDPLARDDLMHILLQTVVDDGATVLISSHAIADLATVCDYVIILSASRVQLADELDNVLASHRMLVGPAGTAPVLPRRRHGRLVGHDRAAGHHDRAYRVTGHRSRLAGDRAVTRRDRDRLPAGAVRDLAPGSATGGPATTAGRPRFRGRRSRDRRASDRHDFDEPEVGVR